MFNRPTLTSSSLLAPVAILLGSPLAASSAHAGGGGDGPATAVQITSLPFAGTGTTADNTNSFDVACPFTGSTAPDEWFTYRPAVDEFVTISLCESAYDTKVYILDADLVPVNCNDDGCSSSGGGGFRSLISNQVLIGGSDYYIVVDGWSGDAGAYEIEVASTTPPDTTCVDDTMPPPGAIIENEVCDDGVTPGINSGCNEWPDPTYIEVGCGDTVIGEAWATGGTRDIDFYRLLPRDGVGTVYRVTFQSEFSTLFAAVPTSDCNCVCVYLQAEATPCEPGELVIASNDLFWGATLFVGYTDFDGFSCINNDVRNDYIFTVTCEDTGCPHLGDFDLNHVVQFDDLITLLDNFGEGQPGGDANGDGDTDFADLVILLANFGPCP